MYNLLDYESFIEQVMQESSRDLRGSNIVRGIGGIWGIRKDESKFHNAATLLEGFGVFILKES